MLSPVGLKFYAAISCALAVLLSGCQLPQTADREERVATESRGEGRRSNQEDAPKTAAPSRALFEGATWTREFTAVEGADFLVASDSADNVIVARNMRVTAPPKGKGPASHWDVSLEKLDSAGNTVWKKQFGGPDYDEVMAMTVDEKDRIIIAGGYGERFDLGGGVLPLGEFEDDTDAYELDDSLFLAMFSSDGKHQWSRGGFGEWSFRVNDGYQNTVDDLVVDRYGRTTMVGELKSSLNFGGGLIAGDYVWPERSYVAQFSPTGKHIWSWGINRDPSRTPASIAAIAVNDDTDLVIAGSYFDEVDLGKKTLTSRPRESRALFLASYNHGGFHRGTRVPGGDISPEGTQRSVAAQALSAGDDFWVATFVGSDSSESPQAQEGWMTVACYDADLKPRWVESFAASGEIPGSGLDTQVEVGPSGKIHIAGHFVQTLEVGDMLLVSAGERDIFHVVLAPDGTVLQAISMGGAKDESLAGFSIGPSGEPVFAVRVGGRHIVGKMPI